MFTARLDRYRVSVKRRLSFTPPLPFLERAGSPDEPPYLQRVLATINQLVDSLWIRQFDLDSI